VLARVDDETNALRDTVRINRWVSPLSPTALRTALMRLVKVESETIRAPRAIAKRSSLLTTRSRFRARPTRRSTILGLRAINSAPRLSRAGQTSSTCSPKENSS